MTSRIRVLSDHTINKIAAGEVVENPASVVKELVENSIDAGATDICIEIKGGGRQLIRITDNGCGMTPDDALLCLERHATSKIREVEDLFSISTMGFRGEAIPSIASISKFTLMTRPPGGPEQGTMVLVDGGKIIKCCPVACPTGTTIEVKALFFNLPVRKKFLKSPIYDANEIYKTVSLLALGNPSIQFQLISNEKKMLSTLKASSSDNLLGQRVASVLGGEFFQALVPLETSKGYCRLEGLIGLPTFTRQNRTGQYLFINKRAVYSPFISYTLREGYGPSIGSHRYPVFVLNLSLPGNHVDVNVHPQKKEVRLRQEYLLKEMLIQAVENSLIQQKAPELPRFEVPPVPYTVPFQPTFQYKEFKEPFFPPPQRKEDDEAPMLFDLSPTTRIPRILTTIPGYIIVDPESLESFGKDGICLIDQRAAHSRVIFEKLSQQDRSKSIPIQSLLIPYTLSSSNYTSALLMENMEMLNSYGISIKEFGPDTFLVDALPQAFGNVDVKEFIDNIVQNLETFQEKIPYQLAAAASRSAVSKNKKLSFDEAQRLLNELMLCQQPYQCPFGKQTMAWMSAEKLAKQFVSKSYELP